MTPSAPVPAWAPRRQLVRPRRGVTLPFVCVMLTVLLGGAALAIDMGRVYLTATEAQAAADASALAAARFLQQNQPYYTYLFDPRFGFTQLVALNRVAGANAQVQSSDVQPVTYDPTSNTVSASSWSSATSAVTVTVRGTPKYVFGGALGITPPSVARKATAWIANVNGATCVRPFALPYTRNYEAGFHHYNQDSTYTRQSTVAPDYSYSGVASLQPQWPWYNTPQGRTYTAIPQWEKENVVNPNGHAVTGRWLPVNFAGGGLTAYQTYLSAAPKSASCQAASTQVGAQQTPFSGYDNPSDTLKMALLTAMQQGMTQLCNRLGNNTDAHCYNSDGTVGVRVRVMIADSVAGASSAAGAWQLNTREVTVVRIMCYFQSPNDVCTPTYIRDENTPVSTPSTYWQLLGSATSGYPAGTISVLLDGPTSVDPTSDLIYGNKPGITQRIFLVR